MTIDLTRAPEATQAEVRDEILSADALAFVEGLHRRFTPARDRLIEARTLRREEVGRTGKLDFLAETRAVRDGDWKVAPLPADLVDRRVEITGPTTRKMTINALNSGARVWLADLEDANTPHWDNVVDGQVNLYDAVRRLISHEGPDGRRYELTTERELPVIVMRPRGWHLEEAHVRVDDRPGIGALVDFGLYFFHNARELVSRGSGPYFYLPKLESHREARLWAEVFRYAEERVGLPHGTVRATVLIETIPAAFEMDEILYELRDYAAGLNAGRWDYLFSIIKYFGDCGARFVLPDRNAVSMTAPFMRAYARLLVRTCHRRGVLAIGGMAAFVPSRSDPEVNRVAFAKVREDKEREARDGFDGSWVAHPDLVPLCAEVFTQVLGEAPNQLERLREDVVVSASDLLGVSATTGAATVAGLRANVDVAVTYLEAWLRGSGAVAIHDLMEDAATAEVSRAQIWQWRHNGTVLDDGSVVTTELVEEVLRTQLAGVRAELGDAYGRTRFDDAAALFSSVALADSFPDFLTLPAYELVTGA